MSTETAPPAEDRAAGPGARPSRIPWPPLLLVAVIAAAWLLARRWPIAWPGMNDMPARIIGYGIGIGGLLLAAWAVFALIRAGTTVRPDARSDVLVTWGPYRRHRNPIYVADVMLLLGLAELTHNIWIVILTPLFIIAVTWLAILPEERHLEARFGDAWHEYKARSKRWI